MAIHPKVTQISHSWQEGSQAEFYFIRGEKNAIVDTGIPQTPEAAIAPTLKNLGLSLASIHLILNTHGHFDHTGGDGAVKAASGAQVMIHGEDAVFLEDHERCFKEVYTPIAEAMGPSYLEAERKSFFERMGPELKVDRKLKDKDVIDLGDGVMLRVAHLPGHTFGSVGFLWETEGILFSGDSLPGLGGATGGLPIIYAPAAYENSLRTLKGMRLRTLTCCHHYRGLTLPPNPIRQGPEVNRYLDESLECLRRLREAAKKVASRVKGKPFLQLADEVAAAMPAEMGFKPVSSLATPFWSAMTVFFLFRELGVSH